jgi:hypothetical protein
MKNKEARGQKTHNEDRITEDHECTDCADRRSPQPNHPPWRYRYLVHSAHAGWFLNTNPAWSWKKNHIPANRIRVPLSCRTRNLSYRMINDVCQKAPRIKLTIIPVVISEKHRLDAWYRFRQFSPAPGYFKFCRHKSGCSVLALLAARHNRNGHATAVEFIRLFSRNALRGPTDRPPRPSACCCRVRKTRLSQEGNYNCGKYCAEMLVHKITLANVDKQYREPNRHRKHINGGIFRRCSHDQRRARQKYPNIYSEYHHRPNISEFDYFIYISIVHAEI